MLAKDVGEAERTVAHLVRVALTQGQFDALVDFCFNLGAGRLTTSSLLRELNAGHYEIAGEQLLRWDFAGGVVNSGLKARRLAEFRLWQGQADSERCLIGRGESTKLAWLCWQLAARS